MTLRELVVGNSVTSADFCWEIDRKRPLYIAGRRGTAGSAIDRHLRAVGFENIVGPTSAELNLRDRRSVFDFFDQVQPATVILAAGKVGGLPANMAAPVNFISENLQIQTNVMDAALEHGVQRLLFLGSSCIYPKFAPQPMTEECLLSSPLEETNKPYAVAKIAGLVQVQAVRQQYGLPWVSVMPANLYGPHDNYRRADSHVMAALIRRFDEAVSAGVQTVVNWGSGTPRREVLHVDDLATACRFVLERYDDAVAVNVGTGVDHTIAELAEVVAEATGYTGNMEWDTTKADGIPQKLVDVTRLRSLGWEPQVPLREGVRSTVEWFRSHRDEVRVD